MIAVSREVSETSSLRDFKADHLKQVVHLVIVPPLEWVCGGSVKAVKNKNVRPEGIVAAHDMAGGEVSAETFAVLIQIAVGLQESRAG